MKGQVEIYQAWISDAAYERTIKNLHEVFPDWSGDLEALAQQLADGPWVGKKVSVVCEEEPDQNGNPQVRIKWLNGPDGGGKIMQASAALQLARRLSGKPPGDDAHTGAPVERARRSQPSADPNPRGIGEDDIPFDAEEGQPQ